MQKWFFITRTMKTVYSICYYQDPSGLFSALTIAVPLCRTFRNLSLFTLQHLIVFFGSSFVLQVVTVWKFQGGGAFNVIPDSVTIGGTFRAFLKESFNQLKQRIEEVVALVTLGLCIILLMVNFLIILCQSGSLIETKNVLKACVKLMAAWTCC